MTDLTPDDQLVTRFSADLDTLVDPDGRVGVAVSGGPDSLALLLLAAAARPGKVEAATVDHGLRPESHAEAEEVAAICGQLGVPHAILTVEAGPPKSNLQAWAREVRYRLLGEWAVDQRLAGVATAHHADDQAETLLMRLARGSGVGGLAGVRRWAPLAMAGERGEHRAILARPLLRWRRVELQAIVERAEITAITDPSNVDERFDRTRARKLLAETDWLDPVRLSAVADHCGDADEALRWLAWREYAQRSSGRGSVATLDPADLPYELQRRLLADAIEMMTGEMPAGPELVRALDALLEGRKTTLAGLKLEGGAVWRLSPAPPRR